MLQFKPTVEVSLDRTLEMCSIYSEMSDQLDHLHFSVEYRDWREASKAYRALLQCDSVLVSMTNESLLGETVSLEQLTTESSLIEATKAFIDKIPALIIKIAVALISAISAAIVYFKKRSRKGLSALKDNEEGSLTFKSYLDSDASGYIARYRTTEAMIVKLTALLNGHMQGDLSGITHRIKEAQERLDQFEKSIKNPFANFTTRAKAAINGSNVVKLRKEYQRNLESSVNELHGVYPTSLYENTGVLVLSRHNSGSQVLTLIENTDRVSHALAKLRNADIDTVLKNIIVSVSLKTDRVVDVTLSREQHDTLRAIIDKTNHVTSELIEKFDSGVEEIKLHIGQIKALGERLEHMSVGPKHKPFLKEILDELNLSTKDITSLIRDIQSLVLHLVIKY